MSSTSFVTVSIWACTHRVGPLGTYLLAHSNGNSSFGSAVMRFSSILLKALFFMGQTDRSSVDALMQTQRAARAAGSSQTWSSDFLTFPKFTHANPRGLSRPQADLPESTHCFVATGISDCRGTGRKLGFEKDCRRSAYDDRVTYLARRIMKVFRETLNSQVWG
jgi:hypothetical protein